MENKKKILIFDVETAPNLGYYFELYREGNIVWNESGWYIMSWSAKWLGEESVTTKKLPDYETYTKNTEDDSELVKELWDLFDEADVLIAHNGDEFDIKKANARFIKHGLTAPSPYKTIDTKKVAKRYFKFDSNKLTDLGEYLGCGKKLETGGYSLWKACIEGNPAAWDKMAKYNEQDVLLLEKIYLKLRPWMVTHPNISLITGTNKCCPNCNSSRVQKRGFQYTRVSKRQQYWCRDCNAWSSGEVIPNEETPLR